jgi:hypothetical protein
MTEYLRPWKLITLALGINTLIYGSYLEPSPDWDVGISVIMAVLAYLTAPWSLRVLLDRRWRMLPLALFWAWLTVDGVYWAWNHALPDIGDWRAANFPASLSLYGWCALIWLYNGSLAELKSDLLALIGLKKRA